MKLSIGWFTVNKELELIYSSVRLIEDMVNPYHFLELFFKWILLLWGNKALFVYLHFDTVISSGLLLIITFLL